MWKKSFNRRLFLVIITSCLLLAIYVGLHSPYYALLQVGKSLAAHDLLKFEKYVDIDQITASSMQQLIDCLKNYPALQDNFNLSLLQQDQVQLTNNLNGLIRDYIVHGEVDIILLEKFKSLSSGSLPQFTIDPSAIDWKIEKAERNQAFLILSIPTPYGLTLPIKGKMEYEGNTWRLTEIVELDKVLSPALTLKSFLK